MNDQQLADRDGVVRTYEYENDTVLVADLGPGAAGTVDVVDGTVIVVVGDDQYDLELPEGELARASMNHGVVTVEVEG